MARLIQDLTIEEALRVDALLFDLDDTLLNHGRLGLKTYESLCEVANAGIKTIGVTGRPASWGEVLIRQWPVDAMITENGTIAFYIDDWGRLARWDSAAAQRAERIARLDQACRIVQENIPSLTFASDNRGRLSDRSFDIGEEQILPPDIIAQARHWAEKFNIRVSQSSIHLHYSYDTHDKGSGSLAFMAQQYGWDPSSTRHRCLYIGDSSNDASAFAAYELSVGVANLNGNFNIPPRFRTKEKMGEGFSEMVKTLLDRRVGISP